MSNDDTDWEKQLEIGVLKAKLKLLTGDEIIAKAGERGDGFEAPKLGADGLPDFGTREEKIARIMRDPKPNWAPPPKRDYPTTEHHYIVCHEPVSANISLPESLKLYGLSHQLGGVIISDRLEVPEGWTKAPPKGASIEFFKENYPELYDFYKTVKKVATF